MSVDDAHRIREFHEKPENPKPLPNDPHRALASMGVYIFNADLLSRELQADHALTESSHDFGKDIIPHLIGVHNVCAYRFGGETGRVTPDRYWHDRFVLRGEHGLAGPDPATEPVSARLAHPHLPRTKSAGTHDRRG